MFSSNSDQACERFAVMAGTESTDHQPAEADGAFRPADLLNSTEVEDDHKLSGYIEDNFEFLDQMDCSVMDHLDCSMSYQVGHSPVGEDEV